MSPPIFYPLLLLLLLLSLSISSIASSSSSSSLATFAISHISNTTLLVCALLPSPTNHYDLNCTGFPNGTTTHHYPSGSHPYTAVAAGDGFLCGLTTSSASSNTTMKWWDFAHNPNKTNSIPPTKRVYKGSTVLDLSAGDSHVCGLIGTARHVNCWRWPDLHIPGGLNLTQIAVGGKFVCGLQSSGKITCFGDDDNGGVVGHEPRGNFMALAAGSTHACGVSVDGELCCWGVGAPDRNMTKNVTSNIATMALGENRTCILDFNGTVHCWGRNFWIPENIATSPFVAIQARGESFCGVVMSNFSLVCWGNERFHENHVAFKLVLPGTCMSECPCEPLAGSGTGRVFFFFFFLAVHSFHSCGPGVLQSLSSRLQASSSSAISSFRVRVNGFGFLREKI